MILDFINTHPLIIAFFLGLIPALVWLWFWLKEDRHPEPAKMITLAFVGGMVSVMIILPLQQIVYDYTKNQNLLSFTLWATIEEVFKFLFVYFIALRNKANDEPVDDVIYLIISALGFVTAENTLFLLTPIYKGNLIETVINGNLRFIGASLLHIVSSGTLGVFMAISYYKSKIKKKIYFLFGLVLAILLHTGFNLLIINKTGGNIFFIFSIVWIGIIVLLVLFEKVKKIKR